MNAKEIRVKPVPVKLDKERSLVYDLNAYIALEEEFGEFDAVMGEFEKGSMKAFRALLWAGLLHEDEKLTPRQAGALMGLGDIERVTEAIVQAIENSMPAGEKTEAPGE